MRKTEQHPKFDSLPSIIQSAIRTIPESERYLVALSGGLDSVALLLSALAFLSNKPCTVRAIHIHHGLSSNADEWSEFCVSLCARLGVHCIVEKVAVESQGEGLEAAARKARYQVFERYLSEGEVLLQGHHQNDQAETVLMRVFKGASAGLLKGMPLKRALSGGVVYRPFLAVPKSVLEDCVQAQGWQWVEDESNHDDVFDRNFIRHKVLPLLYGRWPAVLKNVSGLADELSALVQSQDEWCKFALQQIVLASEYEKHVISIMALKSFPERLQKQILRYWLSELGQQAPKKTFERIWTELLTAAQDANPEIVWADNRIVRYDGALYFTRVLPVEEKYSHSFDVCVDAINEQFICGGYQLTIKEISATIAEDQVDEVDQVEGVHALVRLPDGVSQIVIKSRDGGEMFSGQGGARPLKKYFQHWKVPPWQRYLPLVYFDEDLVVVQGAKVASGYASRKACRNLLISFKPLA